jgi:hypothetical protein
MKPAGPKSSFLSNIIASITEVVVASQWLLVAVISVFVYPTGRLRAIRSVLRKLLFSTTVSDVPYLT